MWASFKNIDIKLCYSPDKTPMPIFGHSFFGHNSAIFEPINLKFFWLARRLSLSIDKCGLFFIVDFWASFGRKMGVATTCAPCGLGPPDPTKTLAYWVDHLGQLQSRNHVSLNRLLDCAIK